MSGLLPPPPPGCPELRCTAYWYTWNEIGPPVDMEFLRELGLRAYRIARWYGLVPAQVPEGPYWVHTWPEWAWDAALADMVHMYGAPSGEQAALDLAQAASAPLSADYPVRCAVATAASLDEPGHGYWEKGGYGHLVHGAGWPLRTGDLVHDDEPTPGWPPMDSDDM